jgi:alpha-L-arabinofuranosidase
VINTGSETVPLTVNLDGKYSRVRATVLTSKGVNDANDFNDKNLVRPKTIEQVRIRTGKMQWDVPRWSIAILHFRA